MASSSEASCISDPNFAVICSFLERFAESCGITYPTFTELQEMLENVEQVPPELVELHIKLLRKARKTVFIEKWERALIKFCHTYSSQDGWEIERFGYKKSRLEVKLRVLKMLLEGQFDLNQKFKTSINTLESGDLRTKPLGKDKLGRVYWLQYDPITNLRVYREDTDEESWSLVAKDRQSLVELLQELSGNEFPLDMNILNEDSISLDVDKPVVDTGQNENGSIKNEEESSNEKQLEDGKVEEEVNGCKLTKFENGTEEGKSEEQPTKKLKIKEVDMEGTVVKDTTVESEEGNVLVKNEVEKLIKEGAVAKDPLGESEKEESLDDNKVDESKKEEVIVGEAIEEPVMYVVGEGIGAECETGNPEKEENQDEQPIGEQVDETAQNSSENDVPPEKHKPAPKLWTIDTICGVNSSTEVNEKVKQKNFSSFSIDSVLEKKDSSNSDGPSVSKFSVSCGLPEHFQVSGADSGLRESNSLCVQSTGVTPVGNQIALTCETVSKTETSLKGEELEVPQHFDKAQLSVNEADDESSTINIRNDFEICASERRIDTGEADEPKVEVELAEQKGDEVSRGENFKQSENLDFNNAGVLNDCLERFKEKQIVTGISQESTPVVRTFQPVENINSDISPKKLENNQTHLSVAVLISHFDKSSDKEHGSTENKEEKIIERETEITIAHDEKSPQKIANDSLIEDSSENTKIIESHCENVDEILKIESEEKPTGEKIQSVTSDVEKVNEVKEHVAENIIQEKKIEEVEKQQGSENIEGNEEDIENNKVEKHSKENLEESSEKATEVAKQEAEEAVHEVSKKDKMESNQTVEDSVKGNEFKAAIPVEPCSLLPKDNQTPDKLTIVQAKEVFVDSEKLETNKEDKTDDLEKIMPVVESVKVEVENNKTEKLESRKDEDSNNLEPEVKEKVTSSDSDEKEIKGEEKTDEVKSEDNFSEATKFKNEENIEKELLTPQEEKEVEPTKEESIKALESEKNEKSANDEVVEGNRSTRKRKKEILPQRILSRNRKTIEESEKVEETLETVKKRGAKVLKKSEEKEEVEKEKRLTVEEAVGEEEEESEGEKEEEEGEEEKEKEEGKSKWRRGRRRKGARRRKTVHSDKSNPPEESEEKEKCKKSNEEEKESVEKDDKNKKKGRPKKEETGSRSGSRQIPAREIKLLGITEMDTEVPSIRQSRRIAQIKMKEEAERRRLEALQLESFKKEKKKKSKTGKKKRSKQDPDSDSSDEEKKRKDEDDSDEGKTKKNKSRKRKKKDKLKFNELNPWISSSGSSTDDEEEEEIEEEPHEDDELVFKSDHEFSPESDVEDPDYKPIKRARTAKVEDPKAESGKYDDTACEECGNNDHPEWILLCDKCDKGWHASCVRPALMVVPEGDWFCPPCEHASLITKLQESLAHYDRCQKQRENEELRRKRLAFVGISLDNVLPPAKKQSKREGEEEKEEESSSESGSGSESESSESGSSSGDSSEPVYQLRERRSNVTSYRYNEYDELIKSALQDEIEAVKGAGNAGRGKDINNIVNAVKQGKEKEENENSEEDKENFADGIQHEETGEEEKKKKDKSKKEEDEDYELDTEGDEEEDEDENLVDEIPPVVPKNTNLKKKKSKSLKITSLDFTSEEEDHNSDSDFKGASSEEESDYSLPSESESSEEIGRKRRRGYDGPLRRSTRARVSRYDRDFINDDSEDDKPRSKKNRRPWDSSESSDSDRSWGRRKRRRNNPPRSKSRGMSGSKKKKKKGKKRSLDSDDEGSRSPKKPRNRKIKYGGLDSLDEEQVLSRRTRGKKINYQEMNGSDSEDDSKPQKPRGARAIESDDDFVAENDKDEEIQDGESEEIESEIDEEEEEGEEFDEDGEISNIHFSKDKKKPTEKKKKILEKIKKKKWVIPDPDDFSENDLMEEKHLDELNEELEDLNEEEEEILGNILESGDVPIHELRAAVKRAKEERKLKKEKELNEKDGIEKEETELVPKTFPPIPAHMEYPGGSKFPKIGKVKITPCRAELASLGMSQQSTMPMPGGPVNFIQNAVRFPQIEKPVDRPPQLQMNDKGEPVNPGSFLLRTLQSDLKVGNLGDANIPSNHSIKDDGVQAPIPPYQMETPPRGPLSMMAMMNSRSPGPPGGNNGNSGMMPMSVNNGRPITQFNAYQGLAAYPATIPTTVTGLSNIESQTQARKKPGPKPGTKMKRKPEETSPQRESLEEGEGDEFQMAGVQDSAVKKRGRGRGKKQLLTEGQVQGKQEPALTTVQAPTQFPPQGFPPPPEGGSVITRMLNTPQSFSGNDPSQFSPGPRNPPPFRPPPYSSPPRPVAPIRMRVPVPGGGMFHTSHPHDPSPSGGGAINIPSTSGGMTKPSPPSPTFNRPPGVPVMPRFSPDPNVRHPFLSQTPPPRPEFSSFGTYYGSYPPPVSSLPGSDEANFQNPPAPGFPEQFGEGQAPGAGNPKSFDEETGGEFGGLASYFASQREDDLDT